MQRANGSEREALYERRGIPRRFEILTNPGEEGGKTHGDTRESYKWPAGDGAVGPAHHADRSGEHRALVVTDPQNDVLSEKGAAWGLVGQSIRDNSTVEHIEQLFKAAKMNGYDVFISPHYYYPTDQGWLSGGAVETMMDETRMFGRAGPLTLDGVPGVGRRLARAVQAVH